MRFNYVPTAVILAAVTLVSGIPAQATVHHSQMTFPAATQLTIPPSSAFPNPFANLGLTDAGCVDYLDGIGVPQMSPAVTVTAPNSSVHICVIGSGWNAGLANMDPTPVGPTIIGNGQDDFDLQFNPALGAVGLTLLTNFQAVHEITLTFDDQTTQVFDDTQLDTDPNSFEFVGFESSKPIQAVFVDTLSGEMQNEGLAEIWVPVAQPMASYEQFGVGCAGSVGMPLLDAAPGSLPKIDGTFTLQLSNLPAGNAAFVVFGFSTSDWAGIPLPGDLTPFGLPGCTVYLSVDVAFPVANPSGTGQFAVPIPNDGSLLGLNFFNQALVLDPGVNFLGAVVTNAGEGVVGPK